MSDMSEGREGRYQARIHLACLFVCLFHLACLCLRWESLFRPAPTPCNGVIEVVIEIVKDRNRCHRRVTTPCNGVIVHYFK